VRSILQYGRILITGTSAAAFFLLPATPANATFKAICYVSSAGLPNIRLTRIWTAA
jgi:hypothetical protein